MWFSVLFVFTSWISMMLCETTLTTAVGEFEKRFSNSIMHEVINQLCGPYLAHVYAPLYPIKNSCNQA